MKAKSLGDFYIVENSPNHCTVTTPSGKQLSFAGVGMPLNKLDESDIKAAVKFIRMRQIINSNQSIKEILINAYSLKR
ncbi:hypothetical protein [Trichormus sp. NMC-1]|uniref:hypothetical protein n=1 Tax=Trichormus sp. NMC-1 TaxID=1853259 RepID=UPI0008DC2923|nr:hypothetical protein [Trichormus sp. NMC-1]